MKPIGLISDEIQISSNRNGIVCDLFLGSGSTLIAAEKTNRICFGMEISEAYCDVIVERYINFMKTQGKEFAIKLNGEIIQW